MTTYNLKLEINAQQVQEILADYFKNQGSNVVELKFNLNSGVDIQIWVQVSRELL